MKTLNKFIFLFLLSFISIGVFSGSIVSAQNTASEPSIAVSEEDSSVYSGDVIVWKYKTMNGKLYKRKYNKTTKNGSGIGFQLSEHEKERKSDILNLISFLFLYQFLRDQRYHNSTKRPTAIDHHIKYFSFSSWNKHLMNLIG